MPRALVTLRFVRTSRLGRSDATLGQLGSVVWMLARLGTTGVIISCDLLDIGGERKMSTKWIVLVVRVYELKTMLLQKYFFQDISILKMNLYL